MSSALRRQRGAAPLGAFDRSCLSQSNQSERLEETGNGAFPFHEISLCSDSLGVRLPCGFCAIVLGESEADRGVS